MYKTRTQHFQLHCPSLPPLTTTTSGNNDSHRCCANIYYSEYIIFNINCYTMLFHTIPSVIYISFSNIQ